MTTYRDIILRRQSREAIKQDKLPFKRAVLVNQYGEQTSSNPLNDVWASTTERRVWYMTDGAVQPAQILCRKVSDPYVGLGVIIGYADNSNQVEVLSDDFFLTQTGDPTGWASTSPRDFEPGGIKQMWVYTKVITPLATYPVAGLFVNVTSGDYVYAGARVTFPGYVNFPLVVPGTPGEHYLAGLYLDAANTLQVVYGAAVAVAVDAPEPAWPAGAFRLSAVLLENGQTTIDFADDVFDRRMPWSDENSGGGAWPLPGKFKIGATEYATLALAVAAAASGDLIKAGEGTFSVEETIPAGVDLLGSGVGVTVFANSNPGTSNTLTFAGSNNAANFTIYNDADIAMETLGDVSFFNIEELDGGLTATSGTITIRESHLTGVGIGVSGGDVLMYGGLVSDLTIFSGTAAIYGTKITGTLTGKPVPGSWWDVNSQIKASYIRHFQLMGA